MQDEKQVIYFIMGVGGYENRTKSQLEKNQP